MLRSMQKPRDYIYMFYKKGFSDKVSRFSHLSFEKVFTGTYWDEFALGAQLHPSTTLKILFLGMADGAGLRPIFASGKKIDLTAIDLNADSLNTAKKLYADNFPNLKFNTFASDAAQFLEQSKESYDLIYVDLYTDTRYADVNFSKEFYRLLRAHLKSDAILLQNAFALPMHLGALDNHGPQREVLLQHLETFKHTYVVPYRRNLTLISMQEIPTKIHTALASDLIFEDRLVLESLRPRLLNMRKLTLSHLGEKSSATNLDITYNEMGTAMLKAWSDFLVKLKSLDPQFSHLHTTRDISDLLNNPDLAYKAMIALLFAGYVDEASALPALFAGEQRLGKVITDKFLDLVFDHWQDILALNASFLYEYLLPQVVAIIIGDKTKRRYLFRLREKIL